MPWLSLKSEAYRRFVMRNKLIIIFILGFQTLLFFFFFQQKIRLLELISSIENEYDTLKKSPTSGFFIQSSGMILEKDTEGHFEVSFSLLDIDLTQLKAIDNSSLLSDALSFYCKNNEQCIYVKDGKTKPRYYRSFEGFYVEFSNSAQSDSIIFKFNRLQQLLLK